MTSPILVVVPARGGSRGIPRKNVRLLAGKPLIWHVLGTIRESPEDLELWVTTDDDEIEEVVSRLNVPVLRRPAHLADNARPLDPVVHHAVQEIEKRSDAPFQVVATVQPTSPLLSIETFHAAIRAVTEEGYDSAITVSEDCHLRWAGPPRSPQPLFGERLNRQQMVPQYQETGAVLATSREFVSGDSRLGPNVCLVVVPPQEAVDIDSYSDWWLAANHLARRKIAIRVDGGVTLGLGHVYRALTLTSRLYNHDIRFFMDRSLPEGISLARDYRAVVQECDASDWLSSVEDFEPSIVILDVLDTDPSTVRRLQALGCLVVTFEDLGEGADVADLVFNALYSDAKADGLRRYSGPAFVCLREEFYAVPNEPPQEQVEEILLTFGGTDPSMLTEKTLLAIDELDTEFGVTVIVGPGFSRHDSLQGLVEEIGRPVTLLRSVKNISKYMARADLAVTSAGRTVFELIACGTPAVVMAQNDRELMHTSADESFGVLHLGLGAHVEAEDIRSAIVSLFPRATRMEQRERMLQLDLWHGPERIIDEIFAAAEAKERICAATQKGREFA